MVSVAPALVIFQQYISNWDQYSATLYMHIVVTVDDWILPSGQNPH